MDLGIAGRRAVVTCGSSGLGLAVAKALAAEGADLVLFARDEQRLRDARDAVRAGRSVVVETVAGDMSDRADLITLREVAESGGVDILVVNTPRPPSPMRDLLDEDDDDRWHAARRDQLDAGLLVLRELAPIVGRNGWGRIVGITSASVKEPMPQHALSTIYRAGLQAALKHLSHELGPRGVTVNSVAPATVVTPTFSAFHDLQRRIDQTALKRAGTTDELAATVAFLASDPAGFITGQTIQLDGGRSTSLV
ncbi:SDR family oxidoreductase [Aeromicrobium senzhongii]|uniref:SDR family oxidoreductase n=1 Tax=Aeromicrobium senzhongii TaxID=2663859 RepID=A0ABX6SRW3_9ACTN|nr:SDR family oxidoreductase [Aeromicrobium senzhongii]MTB88958.1 SDR family oxidoreductase [Aeromicrobium senzhongii]QNL93761.1 SDR family oxidoreductase [Aeromicrobium senzhongii]